MYFTIKNSCFGYFKVHLHWTKPKIPFDPCPHSTWKAYSWFPLFRTDKIPRLFQYFFKNFTACKRSLGQGNIFAPVCHSVHRGRVCLSTCWETPLPERPMCQGAPPCLGDPPTYQGDPPAKEAPSCQGDTPPCQGDSPALSPRAPPGPHQGGNWGGSGPGPHPRGKLRGDQIQAHTQGGNWGGSDQGPHPRGKLMGIRSRPTPKGEIQGDQPKLTFMWDCSNRQSNWKNEPVHAISFS